MDHLLRKVDSLLQKERRKGQQEEGSGKEAKEGGRNESSMDMQSKRVSTGPLGFLLTVK